MSRDKIWANDLVEVTLSLTRDQSRKRARRAADRDAIDWALVRVIKSKLMNDDRLQMTDDSRQIDK